MIDKGLTIAGRHFKFLAYSQSALKEHAVWYVHLSSPALTAVTLTHEPQVRQAIQRPQIGSRNCRKHHSELGVVRTSQRLPCTLRCSYQSSNVFFDSPDLHSHVEMQAFTATDATSVEVEEILRIDDISTSTPSGTKYDFTDGVGTMSLELARAIWSELKASRRRNRRAKTTPRAFQIRFQGCKGRCFGSSFIFFLSTLCVSAGMLSVDYSLKGNVICIRPSIEKFQDPNSHTIDIARAFDKPGPYFLNRPLIMILEQLGVPYVVFKVRYQTALSTSYRSPHTKAYQDRAVQEAQESTRSVKTFARMLETHGLGASYRLPSVLLGLSQLGIDNIPDNKFYSKLLEFSVYHVLRTLKNKARIPIPGGITVVGVADVHKFLKEEEIFVCTREPNSNRLQYIEGDVVISRSPTIHPGDVRIARAIGKPPPGSCFDREPLPNTVVFSVLGESCSGVSGTPR